MNPILKNILAVIAGVVVGCLVNGAIIMVSDSIIPAPNGADVTTTEGLKATIHLFEPKHFIFPFLAHALGTLVGAFLTVKLVANNQFRFSIVIGILFFIAGVLNILMLPSPVWFNTVDLVGAYFPFALLGYFLNNKNR